MIRNLSCECEPFSVSGAPRAEHEGHENNSIAKNSNGIVLTPFVRPLPVHRPSVVCPSVRPCVRAATKPSGTNSFLYRRRFYELGKKGDKKFS